MKQITWRTISIVLAVLGVGVAGYLTYIHYNLSALICNVGNCHTVQSSPYASIAGIPIAILGLLMYLAIIGLGVLRVSRPDYMSTATMVAFTLALAGTLYAAYLTYLEIHVIQAICEWCVSSAILTFLILITEGFGLLRVMNVGSSEVYD